MPHSPTETPPDLLLTLHGPPSLGRAGAPALALERKDAAWLAVLALDGATPRDRLAAWLWPEAAFKTAAGSLRQRIFRLRRRLGHELVHAGARVQLAPGVAMATADAELLSGCEYADCPEFEAWLRRQRGLHRALRLDALTAAAARHEAAGELAAALERVHALLALEPLSEHAQRRLMRLHYLRGDRAAALAAFERFERLLKDELGARPGAETLALLATIEGAAPAGGPVARQAVVPASLQRPPRLVGRDAETAAMGRAWAAGRVFLLLGEAGMGKSRLLAEFAALHGGPALVVAARPGDAGVPFALLARLLRALRERFAVEADDSTRRELARVLPELGGDVAAGEGQRLLLQHAVEWLLGTIGEAGLLLDDIQFADAASLEMLQALLAGDVAAGLCWGFAQRPGDGGPAAQRWRDALVELQRLHEVVLAPLDEPAMAALVSSLALPGLDAAALAPALVRHTGGNPLFALETLKDLVLSGADGGRLPQPPTVGALIERRLKALSPPALALARVAAVAGIDFDIELAAAVLGQGALMLADPWGELQAAQVLSGTAFAHDLVFEAVLRSLPEAIAMHVHGSVATLLQQRGAEPARVAAHWQAAQRWSEAAAAFGPASAAARHAGRIAEALALHDEAVACWRRAGAVQAGWQAELDGVEIVLAGRGPVEAEALARRLAAEAADALQQAAALSRLALVLALAGRWPQARAAAEQSLALGGAAPRLGPRLEAERVGAMALAQLGRGGEAEARLESLRATVDREGTLRQRFEHRSALAYVLNLRSRVAATAAALRETIALAEQAGDTMEVFTSLGNLAACEQQTGHVAAAQRSMRVALLLRERTGAGAGPHALVFEMTLGLVATQLGDFGEALERLENAPERVQTLGDMWSALAANHLAWLWQLLGQLQRAESVLAAAPAVEHVAVARRRALLQGRLCRLRGRTDLALLESALQRHAGQPDVKDTGALMLECSRHAPPQQALALVREVRASAASADIAGIALHALMREVDLLLEIDPGHAAELAQGLAARDPELSPTDAYPPEVDWVLARVAAARGDRAAQRLSVQRAWDWIERAAAGLPPGLRGPFLTRNPVNAAVDAARRG